MPPENPRGDTVVMTPPERGINQRSKPRNKSVYDFVLSFRKLILLERGMNKRNKPRNKDLLFFPKFKAVNWRST